MICKENYFLDILSGCKVAILKMVQNDLAQCGSHLIYYQ